MTKELREPKDRGAIGENLRELRLEQDLSIRALSELIDLSHNTLASYERNKIVPTLTNAIKICDYFEVPLEYLLYGKKIFSDFFDRSLLRMFKTVDSFNDQDKDLAKRFLKKLIKQVKDREKLEQFVQGDLFKPEDL